MVDIRNPFETLDLLGLSVSWHSHVVLVVCTPALWDSVEKNAAKFAAILNYETSRTDVLQKVSQVPMWGLNSLSLPTLVEASFGSWAFKPALVRKASLAIREARGKLDFRPVVIRVLPLDALEIKACLESVMDVRCVALALTRLETLWTCLDQVPALPFSSTLLPQEKQKPHAAGVLQ